MLDTSVLIAPRPGMAFDEATISAASIAELHLGVLRARDPDERARRLARLAVVESAFDPVPIDARIARAWGALGSACLDRGLSPRRRTMDLFIAATAQVLGAMLLTYDRDLAALDTVIEIHLLT